MKVFDDSLVFVLSALLLEPFLLFPFKMLGGEAHIYYLFFTVIYVVLINIITRTMNGRYLVLKSGVIGYLASIAAFLLLGWMTGRGVCSRQSQMAECAIHTLAFAPFVSMGWLIGLVFGCLKLAVNKYKPIGLIDIDSIKRKGSHPAFKVLVITSVCIIFYFLLKGMITNNLIYNIYYSVFFLTIISLALLFPISVNGLKSIAYWAMIGHASGVISTLISGHIANAYSCPTQLAVMNCRNYMLWSSPIDLSGALIGLAIALAFMICNRALPEKYAI
ncbi:hypothetical protein [Chitinivorax sp. B]|uniref:hypothetical protein n=1 Tax=Chitinivorax sp. B TaxID=2502235 RepID=UPI0010F433F5|nr:hypothetical protein [Chitinivorax sp. B]